ncbi:MAG: sugar ABC transporter permease [Chloroflexota bacterium]|nr:sugar ABC transporter permease [Chloroflexota bacterium]
MAITLARSRGYAPRDYLGWLFLIPTVVFFFGWQVYPILRVLFLSFTNYHFLATNAPIAFVGFANYATALIDPVTWLGLGRAAAFTALFVPGMIFIPLLLAVLIDRVERPSVATAYRLILLIPAVIPGAMIVVLWKWMYNFNIGPINYMLVDVLGVVTARAAPQWLGNPWLTLPALAVMEWWWGLGYHTIFFLAGLAAIPRDLYEAARVDGANEWNLFWHVTLPRLRPIMLVLVVLRFGTAMAVIDEYLILGGFNRALPTYTWTVYMWDLAFQLGDWPQGYAAAIGWIGALCMLVVVLGLFWVFRPRD